MTDRPSSWLKVRLALAACFPLAPGATGFAAPLDRGDCCAQQTDIASPTNRAPMAGWDGFLMAPILMPNPPAGEVTFVQESAPPAWTDRGYRARRRWGAVFCPAPGRAFRRTSFLACLEINAGGAAAPPGSFYRDKRVRIILGK